MLDDHNCPISASFTLTDPAQVTASVTSTDVSCFGGSDGIATVLPLNGVGGYSYVWNPSNQFSQTAFNLSGGNYNVTVTDGNGCFTLANTLINEPAQMTATIANFGDVSCFGGTDGFAEVQVFGGTAPYSYFWSTGISNLPSATGLSANTWICNVTDDNGCSASVSQLISQPVQLGAAVINSTDVSCFGECDGSATVSATGGVAPYFYQWNACGNLQVSSLASNLCGDCGVAEVTVTDNSGCTTTADININEPLALLVSSSSSQPHCGFSDGAIQLSISGGTNPYVPNWPAPISQTTTTVDSLTSGIYTITVIDANGCEFYEPVTLNDISGPTISLLNYTDASCFGTCDGIVNTNVAGGTTPYASISWANSISGEIVSTGAVGVVFLCGDTSYCETVIDDAGCQANFCQYIEEPAEVISAVVNFNDVSCFGGNDGDASVLAGGGSGAQSDFSYVWSANGQTNATATALSAGPYSVVSSDANGCPSSAIVTISEPTPLIASIAVTDASCFGQSNGSFNTSVSGGTPFYLYSPSASNNAMPAGNVNVTVTDQNGCVTSANNTINQPTQLTASILAEDAACSDANGSATVFGVAGGTPGYSYAWNGSNVSSPVFDNLFPNPYYAVVTDANGCAINLSVTVNDQPGPVISSIDFIDPVCYGICDGTATVNVSGGTSPLIYHWNDIAQQGGQTAIGLCDGNYFVSVSDDNGCLAIDGGAISQPAPLVVVGSPSAAQICAGESVTLAAAPSGGTPSYSIDWDVLPDDWSNTFTPIPSSINTYNFTVTDANGCVADNSVIVSTGAPLLVDMPDTVETCLGNPVLVSSTGFGGTAIADYQWTWSTADVCNGVITCDIQVAPTDTTTYLVTLEDGCSEPAYGSIVVIVNPVPTPAYGVLENEGCPPFEAFFNGNSSMDNSSILWDLNGDGIIDHSDENLPLGQGSNPVYTYDESGYYTVAITVVSDKQCETTVAIQNYINIYPRPIANFSVDPQSTTLINPVVNTNAYETIGADSLLSWDFNDPFDDLGVFGTTASHVYSDTGTYYIALDAVNSQGCHDYDTIPFTVNPDFAIYAPNAFSPNDDAINDGFKVKGVGIDENSFKMYIYDRWGEVIFYTEKFDEQWDGSVKNSGKIAPNDVYIWKVFVKPYTASQKADPEEFIGSVTIVK